MLQSVLFGNGFNLLGKDAPSWDELLKEISDRELDKNIPNTFKYENLILGKPYWEYAYLITKDGFRYVTSDGDYLMVRDSILEEDLKKKIADRVSRFVSNNAYRKLSSLPVDHYMTTNYDKTLLSEFSGKSIKAKNRVEKLYNLRRKYTIDKNNRSVDYWPIHGCMDSPKSIMLGLDHYCGYLGKINEYLKGDYEIPGVGRIKSMLNRLINEDKTIYSWVDLFFLSDVHIIGFGFDYAETDLWWILNMRMRFYHKFQEEKKQVVNNRIYFYSVCKLTEDKRQTLEGFGVRIIDLKSYSSNFLRNYKKQMDNIMESIRERYIAIM